MTPTEKARSVHQSIDLEFNPYQVGSVEDAEYINELLRLASQGESDNE